MMRCQFSSIGLELGSSPLNQMKLGPKFYVSRDGFCGHYYSFEFNKAKSDLNEYRNSHKKRM